MSEGIFEKYNVEVTDIKLGGMFQVFVRQNLWQICGSDVATSGQLREFSQLQAEVQ